MFVAASMITLQTEIKVPSSFAGKDTICILLGAGICQNRLNSFKLISEQFLEKTVSCKSFLKEVSSL